MIVGKLVSLARLIIVATYTGTSRLRLQQISSSAGNFKVKNCGKYIENREKAINSHS
jgi:hypothetical protein